MIGDARGSLILHSCIKHILCLNLSQFFVQNIDKIPLVKCVVLVIHVSECSVIYSSNCIIVLPYLFFFMKIRTYFVRKIHIYIKKIIYFSEISDLFMKLTRAVLICRVLQTKL